MPNDATHEEAQRVGDARARTQRCQGNRSLPDALSRDREDLLPWAARLVTFEASAAIELRGRIETAIKLLNTQADRQHVIAVLEGREPW